MSTAQAARGKVLAEFAKSVDEGAGWWFRAPKDPNSSKGVHKDGLHPDGIMPQLGPLFFLEESAMLAMLHQMGCYEMKGKMSVFNKKGWDNLASEFKIPPTSWEIGTCRLGPVSAVTHYIKIGSNSMKPQEIYKNYKKAPKAYRTPSVSTRQSKKLVAESMVRSLRDAGAFTSMVEMYSKMTDPTKIVKAAGIPTCDDDDDDEATDEDDDDDDDAGMDEDGDEDEEVSNAANLSGTKFK
jgi:hypothetical protein